MYRQLVPFVRLGVATLVPAMATIAIAAALPASSAALPPEPRASVKLYFQGSPLNAYPTLVRGYRVLGLVRNGTLLVPFDDVLAQLGATDIAVDRARVVTMRQGAHTIALRLTSRAVTIDGKLSGRMLDVAPEIVDGKLFVPLRAAAEALGASVSWEPPDVVRITAPAGIVLRTPPATSSPTTPPSSGPTRSPAPPTTPLPSPAVACCGSACTAAGCRAPGSDASAPPLPTVLSSPAGTVAMVLLALIALAALVAILYGVLLALSRTATDDRPDGDGDPTWIRFAGRFVRAVPWTRLVQGVIVAFGLLGAAFHALPVVRKADDAFPVFDAVTATWLLAIVIAYYLPSLSEFSIGGFKAVIRGSADKPVIADVLRFERAIVDVKASASELPRIKARRPTGLEFVVGDVYDDDVIREYVRQLAPTLRWVVFRRGDGRFVGFTSIADFDAWLRAAERPPPNVAWMDVSPNVSVSARISESTLHELPGFLDRRYAVHEYDSRRRALLRFRRLKVAALAVLTDDERFAGTIDRVTLLEDLLFPLLERNGDEGDRDNRDGRSQTATGSPK